MQSVSINTLNSMTPAYQKALQWTVDEIKWGTSLYLSGLYTLIFHPFETLKNLGRAVWHPLDTSESVAEQLVYHPLGSAVNIGLSLGTGMALNYVIESSTLSFTLQTGLEAGSMDSTVASSAVSNSLALPEIAAAALEATTATVMFITEIASSKSMRLLRQAAKALCHFETEH